MNLRNLLLGLLGKKGVLRVCVHKHLFFILNIMNLRNNQVYSLIHRKVMEIIIEALLYKNKYKIFHSLHYYL